MERWIRPLPARWAVVLGAGLLALSLGLTSYRVWAVEEAEKKAEKQAAQNNIAAPIKREDLRYGGKDFHQWRKDMLTELKGSIRVDGIKAFAAFGANGYGPEATLAILEMMRGYNVISPGDDSAVVQAGYFAVVKIGAPALGALTRAAEGKNRNARLFAITALEGIRSDARSAVPVLLKAMKNEDVTTRKNALEAVRLIDDHAEGYVPALIEALKDEAPQVRSLAAARLREVSIVKNAKPAIPALLEALRDKDSDVRLNAIQTLNSIGAEKQGVGVVSRWLQDKDFRLRGEAYNFLQSLGPDANEAVPALIAVLKAPRDGFTNAAVHTLAKIGPAAKDAVPELTKLLRSDNDNVRQHAMQALEQISPDDKR